MSFMNMVVTSQIVITAMQFYRTQVYLGYDLWVQVSDTNKQTLLKFIQVIDSKQVMDSMQVIDSKQVIDSIQRRWPFLVAPSGGQIWN